VSVRIDAMSYQEYVYELETRIDIEGGQCRGNSIVAIVVGAGVEDSIDEQRKLNEKSQSLQSMMMKTQERLEK
jgi:hypothetical protein